MDSKRSSHLEHLTLKVMVGSFLSFVAGSTVLSAYTKRMSRPGSLRMDTPAPGKPIYTTFPVVSLGAPRLVRTSKFRHPVSPLLLPYLLGQPFPGRPLDSGLGIPKVLLCQR